MKEDNIFYMNLKSEKKINEQILFTSIQNKIAQSKEKLCLLINIEDLFISNSFKSELEFFLNKYSSNISSAALIGSGKGVRKVIMQTVDFPLYFANDREEAEEWLLNRGDND